MTIGKHLETRLAALVFTLLTFKIVENRRKFVDSFSNELNGRSALAVRRSAVKQRRQFLYYPRRPSESYRRLPGRTRLDGGTRRFQKGRPKR
jgi:hypothetical protein